MLIIDLKYNSYNFLLLRVTKENFITKLKSLTYQISNADIHCSVLTVHLTSSKSLVGVTGVISEIQKEKKVLFFIIGYLFLYN